MPTECCSHRNPETTAFFNIKNNKTMETTKSFTQTIKTHLDAMAANDATFAQKYASANKTLDECVTYILNKVYESGKNGFTDDEIYGMAIHYYDEENIEVKKDARASNVHIVGNYDTTEEDIAAAKAAALKRLEAEAYEKMKAKAVIKKPAPEQVQPTLF